MARIRDQLRPDDEGILCGSLADAEAKLQSMLKDRKARGLLVSYTEEKDGRLHSVSTNQGQLVERFYIDE